ncbi:MAG: site-2 protease family protein [Chloroflexi bacterium]|nr:site-2 protease family protein [Chloroflexota bacterium]
MPVLDTQFIIRLSLIAIILLAALPFHEFAHALTAYRMGDGTAKLFGRLTLNPIVHFDPVGGTLLILTLLTGSGFVFGWAKPTPVNPSNLRGGRRSDALVALAGPVSNLILATAAAIPFRVILATGGADATIPLQILYLFIAINISLMIFNLIPLPPLDGSHVLLALVDPRTSWQLRTFLTQYGSLILLGLILVPSLTGLPSPLGIVFEVIANPVINLLTGL